MKTAASLKTEFNCTIRPEESRLRLDQFLASRFTYLSRHQWQVCIRDRRISINGSAVFRPSLLIHEGDILSFTPENHTEPPVATDYTILYRDDAILVINKPGDLPVHPAGPYRENTLQSFLERDLGLRVFPLHRIDRETSGCIAFALSPQTARQALAHYPLWKKRYIALVRGILTAELRIDIPLGPDKNSPVKKKRLAFPGAEQTAETSIAPLRSFADATLITAEPKTGRLHQIRVHCQYAGFPILGDRIYGGNEQLYLDFIQGLPAHDGSGFNRTALHASELTIIHPETTEPLTITAELPGDFREFISKNDARN